MTEADLIPVKIALKEELGGISHATYWRGVKSGRFPKPIKFGPYIARLSRAECREYVARLKAERGAA
jgi:predicted DNA-binding transcriptional regulator AlpA